MFNHNISKNIGVDIAIAPVAAGTGDTQTGLPIDTLGAQTVQFVVYLGTLTSTAVTTLKLQHGDAADLSDATDVTGSSVTVPQSTGGSKGWLLPELYRPIKRYARVAVTRATANAVIAGGFVMLGRESITPPVQGATMANTSPGVLVGL